MRLFLFLAFLCLASTGYAQQNTTTVVDTIITYHPETLEETIEIVMTERAKENLSEKAVKDVSKLEFVKDENGNIVVDTIITFDPVSWKEEIQIVKRVKKLEPR